MTMKGMDAFTERYFPIDGHEFVERCGTYLCSLDVPVDLAPVVLRILRLRFILKRPDPGWTGTTATERRLELRTSLSSFHFEAGYAGWLLLVIKGFLDTAEIAGVREAFRIERG